jgi:hypothetical protein
MLSVENAQPPPAARLLIVIVAVHRTIFSSDTGPCRTHRNTRIDEQLPLNTPTTSAIARTDLAPTTALVRQYDAEHALVSHQLQGPVGGPGVLGGRRRYARPSVLGHCGRERYQARIHGQVQAVSGGCYHDTGGPDEVLLHGVQHVQSTAHELH